MIETDAAAVDTPMTGTKLGRTQVLYAGHAHGSLMKSVSVMPRP